MEIEIRTWLYDIEKAIEEIELKEEVRELLK